MIPHEKNEEASSEGSGFQSQFEALNRKSAPGYRNYIIGFVALLWIAGIVSLYYLYHKPLSPAQALSIATLGLQIAIAFVLISIGGALGRRLIQLQALMPLARLSLHAALGTGLLGIGYLVIGATLGVRPLYAWLGLILLGILLRHQILYWWRDWHGLSLLWKASGRMGRAIALGVAAILLFTLITALAPPLKFDALVYHLALPRAYLTAGKIIYVPQIMFWGMPQLGEMLYTWAMALAGVQSAAVLGWWFGVLALAGLAGFVSENVNVRDAWISVASLLAGFSLASALAWGYVDWLTILYGTAFLASLESWRRDKNRRHLVLAGIYTGMALGTKYSAGVLLIAGAVVLIWFGRKFASWKHQMVNLALFAFWAGVISLPWFVKNILATGNPVYPLFFPSGAMDVLRIDLYQNGTPWGNWLDTIFLPLRATLLGLELAPGYSSSVGPLLLAFGMLAGLSWLKPDRHLQTIVALSASVALPGLLVWAVLGRMGNYLLQSRLYYSIFPALAVLVGIGFESLAQLRVPGVRLGRVAGALVVFVLWLSVFEVGMLTLRQDASRTVLGFESQDDYLDQNLGMYAVAMRAIRDLPPDARVLMLWEPRSLYCAPKCTPDEVLDRWLHDRAVWKTNEAVLKSWKDEGFTHLLYYRLGASFLRQEDRQYRPEDWHSFDELVSQLSTPVNFGEAYSLYKLNP